MKMKELVPITQIQKSDQKAIPRSPMLYTRSGTPILRAKIDLVGVKKDETKVKFSLPRIKAEIIDLTESPPKSRPTIIGSSTKQISKIPKPSTSSLNLQAELENIFPDFAASVQKVIMKHKGPNAAYYVLRKALFISSTHQISPFSDEDSITIKEEKFE